MGYQSYLRTNSTTLELGEVLRSTPDVLLGVGPGAVATLSNLGIHTVFDLARSSAFRAADVVVRAASDAESAESRTGELPGDLFTAPQTGSLADAPRLDVGTLRQVAAADGNGALAESLDVRTIRDLALWPPYLAARAILAEAVDAKPVDADGTPGDLLPMSGRYPTERAYYSTFVLADIDDPTGGTRTALEDAGPLDPVTAVSGPGFTRPVRGARLTFAQSWYSQGVALGQLLHSLALAPGESTRVAMIDWSRQQSASQMDQGGQTEQLVGDTTEKRAMSEVQNAVAIEAQNGFSQSNTKSQQANAGGGGGLSVGPLTLGGSGSYGSSSGQATTVTGTSGVRSIAAAMTQNVSDATHQAASSARNMYASVVQEVSQAEHENISTRLVANFNHMHALTVQYYEVVQIYRTSVGLHRFEPCLFVPMKSIDFLADGVDGGDGPGDIIVRRYRAALQAAALDSETRTLLDPDALSVVEIRPDAQAVLTVLRGVAQATDGTYTPVIGQEVLPTSGPAPVVSADQTALLTQQIQNLRRILGRDIITRDGDALEVPDDVLVRAVAASFPCGGTQLTYTAQTSPVQVTTAGPAASGDPFAVAIDPPVRLSDIAALQLSPTSTDAQVSGVVTLTLDYQGSLLQVPVPVVVAAGGAGYQQAMTFQRRAAVRALLRKLADDQLYYSQVVWQAMDSATVALLLGPYTYSGQPLAQVVDPAPIGVSGNYLIFRMPWEARDLQNGGPQVDAAYSAWITKHADFQTTAEDMVPLPSGGVFAEAVLGRSNSAEKIDITRFWNWQDSPIPLQAPDIAAIQSGSRAQQVDTTPGSLAAPVVAFNNPAPLPDPTGLAATLGALSNGSIFRDSSGATTTQALALAALANAGQGATGAGQQAAANAAVAAQKEIELAKIAAGLITGGQGGSVTEQGAKINEGRSLDERGTDGTTHETQAAEGDSGKALDIIGGLSTQDTPAAPHGNGKEPAPTTEEV